MKAKEVANNLYKNEKGNIEITPETFVRILKRYVKDSMSEGNTLISKERIENYVIQRVLF